MDLKKPLKLEKNLSQIRLSNGFKSVLKYLPVIFSTCERIFEQRQTINDQCKVRTFRAKS